MNQLEFTPARPETDDLAEHVHALTNLLRTNPGWMHARALLALMGIPDNEDNRRDVRDWASKSEGWIISGPKGYCHLSHVDKDAFASFERIMLSQIRAMGQRLVRSRRCYHKLIG